jgi:cell division septation protein DedD
MQREGLDFHAAKSLLEEELAQWKERLLRQGRLELPRVGTFFRDAEHNLQFEPDKRVNYLKDAFGLRPVTAIPVEQPEVRPVRTAVVQPLDPARTDGPRVPAFLAAAATIAILMTAATWWVMGNHAGNGVAWGGFNLFGTAEPALYVPPPAPPTVPAPEEIPVWKAPAATGDVRSLPIAGPNAPAVAVDLRQGSLPALPESTAVDTPAVRLRFHIIGGCFLEKENADRFVSELQAKGFAASVVDRKGGLYRVAYGSYPLRSTAMEALDAVRKEEAPDAWMLVK